MELIHKRVRAGRYETWVKGEGRPRYDIRKHTRPLDNSVYWETVELSTDKRVEFVSLGVAKSRVRQWLEAELEKEAVDDKRSPEEVMLIAEIASLSKQLKEAQQLAFENHQALLNQRAQKSLDIYNDRLNRAHARIRELEAKLEVERTEVLWEVFTELTTHRAYANADHAMQAGIREAARLLENRLMSIGAMCSLCSNAIEEDKVEDGLGFWAHASCKKEDDRIQHEQALADRSM